MGSGMLFSQTADRLYMSLSATGRVYDITGVPATLPTPLTTPDYSAATPERISNLAVGFDTPGGAPSNVVFIHSNTAASSVIYKNTVTTGQSTPAGTNLIGGIGTNNVPKTDGNPSGLTYGFSNTAKRLYQIYPTSVDLGPVTAPVADAVWNNTGGNVSTIWASDTFFDYQNNVFVFVQNTNAGVVTRYLYRVNPTTLVATRVSTITGPVGATAASATTATTTTVGNIRGLAYLNGLIYAVSVNNNTQLFFYRINLSTGTSTYIRNYAGLTNLNATNQDLASVPYYIPFIINCGGSTILETAPIIAGTAANRTLRVPISSVYEAGTYNINVSGPDFTTVAYTATIASTTTFIDVPITYNGTGSSGLRALTVGINGSTTTCTVNVSIERDLDNDGIADILDLDSDNDGILDIFECADSVVDTNYSSTDGTVTTFSAPAADLGFIFDVYTLDNSFNLNINGTNLSTSRLEFQQDQTDNVRFLDGDTYGSVNVPQIYNLTGTAAAPIVRIIIHKNGSVNMYGSKVSGGPLFPLQLYNGNTFNSIVWNRTGANSVVLSQLVVGPTSITGRANGLKNGVCDSDTDGLSNQYDVDSDGDGCPDSVEGSETVKFDQVHSLSLPVGDANYAYRGQIKVLGNGTTTGTPAQIISTVGGASGVPQLVNYSVMNNSGISGVADNTDGTSDVGQGIGDSQTVAANACICYKPTITAGTVLDTNQGITSLQRAGSVGSNWPMVRKGAWTALESKTKGFVPNRLTTAQITAIPAASLIEGMMVYNITLDCLQINIDGTATGWKCFNTQTCSDVN